MSYEELITQRLILEPLALAGFPHLAFAAQNVAMRTALKFQEHPNGNKQGSNCVNFVPNQGKPGNDDDVNGCKLFPGDTEVRAARVLRGLCV